MSPHNTRYKNKATSASPSIVASKHSPPSSKSKTKSKSMSSSPSSSSSNSASGALSKPKRPLSAYNLFFKHARDEMLASTASSGSTTYDHSKHATTLQSPSARRDLSKRGRPPPHRKIGFAEMARNIGAQWKALEDDRREHFESLARVDKQRYLKEMKAWKAAGGDKELPQKDKKDKTGEKGAPSKSSNTRKSPPGSPRSKKSRKKSKADASNVAKSTTKSTTGTSSSTSKETEHGETYSHGDYLTYHNGVFSSSQKQEAPAIDGNLHSTLDQARVSNNPRTVSARGSITNSSAESLYDGTDGGTFLANYYQNGMIDPYTHRRHGHQRQMQPRMPRHADFQPPPAPSARRVSEENDGGDFLSETTMYSAPTYYHGQQHSSYVPHHGHSYVPHHGHWQHQSGQPPHYSYQQIAPGDIVPSSFHRRHDEIASNDCRNVSISSTYSDAQADKIVPMNWNTTMGGYPSHQASEIEQSTKTSSSSGNAASHKSGNSKWSDFDEADRLLDVLGKIDDEDVKCSWATANPMA